MDQHRADHQSSAQWKRRVRWKLSDDLPRSTRVEIYRDGDLVNSDWGLEGDWKDHLVLGERYTYSFSVRTQHGRCEAPVVMDVKVPTQAEWSPKALATSADDVAERYRETVEGQLVIDRLRADMHKEVDAKPLSEEDKLWERNAIDSIASDLKEESL